MPLENGNGIGIYDWRNNLMVAEKGGQGLNGCPTSSKISSRKLASGEYTIIFLNLLFLVTAAGAGYAAIDSSFGGGPGAMGRAHLSPVSLPSAQKEDRGLCGVIMRGV